MRLPSLEKSAFLTSLFLLAFLYGIVTQSFGWFPSALLQSAWNQAEAVSPFSTDALSRQPPQWSARRVYERSGVAIPRPDRVQPGLTLIASAWRHSNGWSPGLRLIDQEGRVLHEWQVRPKEIFEDTTVSPRGPLDKQDIQGVYLFPGGDVLVNVEYVGAVRLDACGRTVWRNSRMNFHHSVARDSDGSFWLPGVRRDVEARSDAYPDGYPGLDGPIHRSLIVKLSSEGEVIDTINVLDVLYRSGLHRYIPQAMLDRYEARPYGKDIVHMNDIEPLPDSMASDYPLFESGDLLVSLRQPHLVFVVDPVTEEVKWHMSDPFIHQHDPDFLGDGWIGVFDNNHDGTRRGEMLGGSRIVLVNPQRDSLRVVFPTPRSEPFYTNVRGKWQMLPNGNLLLTEAQAGRVVEVGKNGETVWEWIQAPSDEETVPSVTEGTRLSLSKSQLASWSCSAIDSTSASERSNQP